MKSEEPIELKVKEVKTEPVRRLQPARMALVGWVIAALILLIAPVLAPRIQTWWKSQMTETAKNDSFTKTDRNNERFDDGSISAVVEKVSPSVVSIVTSTLTRSFIGNIESSGAGTGVVVTKDGYVLTNKHVIESAEKVEVITSNGDSYDRVKVIYEDPLNDLAILKINAQREFSPIEIGDSKTIKVGQSVLAIGNSLGQYQNTVTRGIISGQGREIAAQAATGATDLLTDMLQTDAAINSGNSGGPLVNAGGQLIGINTAVAKNANGLGFAIPISAAKGLLKQLGSDSIARAMLGVSFYSINPAVAKAQDLSEKKGALVANDPVKDSAAGKAGIRKGDIITHVNDLVVGQSGGLNTLVAEFAPNDKIVLKVKRGDRELSINVILQEAWGID